LGIGLKAYPRV